MKKEYEEKINKILIESDEFLKREKETKEGLQKADKIMGEIFGLFLKGNENEAQLELESLRSVLQKLNEHLKKSPSLFNEETKTILENYFTLELLSVFLKKDDFYWPSTLINLEANQQFDGLFLFLEQIFELTPLFTKQNKYDRIIKIKEWTIDFYSLIFSQKEKMPYLNKKLAEIKKYIRQWEDLLLEKGR